MSVLTMNIWSGERDWKERLEALSREIHYWKPDVLCLQEVRTSRTFSTARLLSETTGMQLVKESYSTQVETDVAGTAILSNLAVTESETLLLPSPVNASGETAVTRVVLKSPSGRLWQCFSAYLAWGPHSENTRLTQVKSITQKAEEWEVEHAEDEYASVLTGDFNTLPNWSTVRYLTGADSGKPDTLWVDAWATSGDGDGDTSSPSNPWSADAAQRAGIADPRWVPGRRIDYILVKGYAYGRPGYPINCSLAGTPKGRQVTPSDHYGIYADLWDPRTR